MNVSSPSNRDNLFPASVRPLTEDDALAFADLCAREPLRLLTPRLNTEVHGFASPSLRIWGAFAEDQETLLGILLRLGNTLVAVDSDGSCGPLFAPVVDSEERVAGIRGTLETILALKPALRRYSPNGWEKSGYMRLTVPPVCPPARMALARRASLNDLDRLALLYANAGIMYRSRQNVALKLEKDRAFVVDEQAVGWRPARIVACALLNAEGHDAGLIGGVFTLPQARGKGYASACAAAIAADLQKEGKLPCLFYENPIAGRVYQKLGFEEIGQWAVLYLTSNRRPHSS